MSGCCRYFGRCDDCIASGSYWFTLNTTESVVTCCCHDPHNQPGTIIDWAEYPSQCKFEGNPVQPWVVLGYSLVVFIGIMLIMTMIYFYKRGSLQRIILRRGRGHNDDLPLVRYESVYDTEMTTIL